MKKTYILLVLVILTGITLIFSCRKNETGGKPLSQIESVAKSVSPDADFHFGSVDIITTGSKDVVISIREKTDVAHEKIYVLQRTTDGGQQSLNTSIKNAEVIYLLNGIIINSLDNKERYYFAVAKTEEKEILEKLPADYKDFFTQKSYGYGLIRFFAKADKLDHEMLKSGNSLNIITSNLNQFAKKQGTYVASEPGECNSGGHGSTACSISGTGGCSVSCSSGYYACCSVNSCKCISVVE